MCLCLFIHAEGYSQVIISKSTRPVFNIENDLLLAHYDCKTDVDDLHSAAAFATIIASPAFSGLNYHAVAGAYGIQDGLYVPPNSLFETAFGNKWSDAHSDFEASVDEVSMLALKTIENGGRVWIAEGGQSDFSAAVVDKINTANPEVDTRNRIHIVQHSDWNEEVTSPDKLEYVKKQTSYHKISDGNAAGNGTPCFRTEKGFEWSEFIENPHLLEVWNLAISLGNEYNGRDGRYLNKAVLKGGFDFSDTAEISWILSLDTSQDARGFFESFGQ